MLKTHLKVALRTLRRQGAYSLINIAGLTIGLACCLLIFQHVAFERSFDRFHENADELYRVVQAMAREGDEMEAGATFTPYAMGPALVEDLPEVERFTRVHPMFSPALVSNPSLPERVFEEEDVYYADPAFLEMFTFPLDSGDSREALQPGTAVVSRQLAQKYFGESNPMGEVLEVSGQIDGSYRVVGLFSEVPANSHLQFEMLLPMDDLLRDGQYASEPDGWWSNNFITYIQLHPAARLAEVNQKMTDMLIARRGEVLAEAGWQARLYAQPLPDVYLNADVVAFATTSSSRRTVYFFTIIGLVTLLIALVNYINLATARAMDRAREVGVRKAVGAQRKQLVGQFLTESAITILAAAVLSVIVAILLMPVVNGIAATRLSFALWLEPAFLGAFSFTLIAAIFLAGLYPAIVLSGFRPATVLAGKSKAAAGQLWLRRGLVVFQFAAAVVLIGGTVIVYNQLDYMQSMDLGLNMEQVITVPGPRVIEEGTTPTQARLTFLDELRRLPSVRNVATSWALPGQGFNWHGASTWRAELEETDSIRGVVTYIDTSFASLYGMELIAGTGFTDAHAIFGTGSPSPILANESAVRALGFATPEEALDHPLQIATTEVAIVGVLRDFNWSSAHEERENIFFGRTAAGGHISIQIAATDLPSTIAAIERTYGEMFPGNVFKYRFLDEAFAAQYQEEQRFAALFSLFAGLAIFIACLGLFGLATFTAQQRTKELGVRKVLGASSLALVSLLSRDFLKLVAVAALIGSPVAYLLMRRWLDDFAYRIELGPEIFLITALLAIVVALATVATQAYRAAVMDPVRSLRSE